LAEKKDRSKEENDKLAKHLQAAREQLQMTELLGYAKKKDFNPMYEQISEIEKNLLAARVASGGSTRSSSNFPICSEAMRRVAG
jgi:hypothetical protein